MEEVGEGEGGAEEGLGQLGGHLVTVLTRKREAGGRYDSEEKQSWVKDVKIGWHLMSSPRRKGRDENFQLIERENMSQWSRGASRFWEIVRTI